MFAQDAGKAYPHWIYVDFRTYSKAIPAIKFVCEELKASINKDPFLSDYERCVRHAYKEEIEALFKGPLFLLAGDEGERKRKISRC